MTVHLPSRRREAVELVLRWEGEHTAADVRAALSTHLDGPVGGLVVAGQEVPDDAVLGLPPLLDRVSLVVVGGSGAEAATTRRAAALDLVVVGGPDAGHCRPLVPPGFEIGRRPASGLRLDDIALSRTHARVEVGADGVRVADLGSTNGVLVDDRAVEGAAAVDVGSTVVLGHSTLRLRRAGGVRLPVAHPGDGTVLVTTVEAPVRSPARRSVEPPPSPTPPASGRIPWLTAVVPLPVALVLAVVLGPQLLAFALLGPVMVLGNAVGDRWSGRRQHRRAQAEHAEAVRSARVRLEAALAEERRERHGAHPDPHQVLRRVEHRLGGLWSAGSAQVRLGLGDVESATSWVADGTTTVVPLEGAPVVVDLDEVGHLGVAGDPARCRGVADWLVGQLCAALRPEDLHLDATSTLLGAWLLVPHARNAPGRDARRLRVVRVEEESSPLPTRRDGRDLVVVLAATAGDLPDACRARLLTTDDGRHVYVDPAGTRTVLTADGVGIWWVDRVARGLAPLRPSGGGSSDAPDGPVTTATVLGSDRLTRDGVAAHWADSGGAPPTAVVGTTGTSPYRLDLARDGPHVLVGGTTGSGKSEFLRTLAVGLALECPPERLVLLLVDFKGGAAFGPCAALPHVVGLVTDLDEHLVHRVLISLRAELIRRERVLASAGVSDIDALGAGPPVLPRLVVVVDELRALVDERPDVVSELVRLAAQGRSLGIHLVLATQRPAGTVTPEIQANVDLRLAFRVRDRTDSVDVLDAPDAALIPPGAPGRGYARGADGTLTPFRTALVAPPAGHARRLEVLDAGSAQQPEASPPEAHRVAETAAVVAVVAAAAVDRTAPAPVPPWVPPLPRTVRAQDLDAPPDVVALVDEPDRQRRGLLTWAGSSPPWRVVGRPASGRTSALRTLVAAATAGRPPEQLHVHVVDAAGGLDDLRGLPHLGTYCRAGEEGPPELVDRLAREVATRRSPTGAGGADEPLVLLVVDGWEQLAESDDPRSREPVSDAVVRVLRDGAGVGISGLVAGGRGLLHSRWAAVGGETLLLGRVDALDAVTVGVRERDLPVDPPPGRALLVTRRREVQVVHVPPGDVTGGRWPPPAPHRRPWRHRPLPELVRRSDLDPPAGARPAASPDPAAEGDVTLLLGCGGPEAAPWYWSPRATGGRFLVAGPPRSGRTSTLRVVGRSARAAGRAVAAVHGGGAPSPLPLGDGVSHLGPDDVDALVALRHADPRLVLLVDDADRLDDAPVGPVIAEIADLAARDAGAVVVATTTGSLATRFRGLDVDTARHGCGLVLSPRPGDGEVLGVRARRGCDAPPGRGVAVVHGRTTPVQVLWDEPSAPGRTGA